MRIGTNYNLLIMNQNMQRARREYGEIMAPMTSGRNINKLSDDPSRLSTVMEITKSMDRREQFLLNINSARSRLGITESVLSQVNDLMQEAYELTIQGNNEALTTNEITGITTRIAAIKEDVLALANAKQGGIYLFSGFESTTQPFTGTAGVYNGDTNTISYKVSETKSVAVNINGQNLFAGGGGNVDIFGLLDNMIADINTQNTTNIGTRITEAQTVINNVQSARANVGGNLQSIQFTENVMEDAYIQNSERAAAINDVDMAKAASDLSLKEFLLQTAMTVSARVMNIQLRSFFD